MKQLKATLIIFIIFSVSGLYTSLGQVVSPISCTPYYQDIKTDIPLPTEAGSDVVKLFRTPNSLIAVTSNGVFKFRNGKWTGETFCSGWGTAAVDLQGVVWLASVRAIQKEGGGKKAELPDYNLNDTITCLVWEKEKTLLVGTTSGLLSFDGVWKQVPFTKGKKVNSIIKDAKGDLWIATNDGLLRRMDGKWINLDDNLMAFGLKRSYYALENGYNKAEVLFGGQFSVGCIAEDGNHWILRGADGLPYGPVTTIRTSVESMWLGNDRGAMKKDKDWHYYNGKRWLPNNKVNDILALDERTVWLATPEGISQVQQVEMTLAQKAVLFEERIKSRHDRYGLVSGSSLLKPGDLSTSQTGPDDNDGLWTSIYLASECFRYAVTKDPEAKINAIKSFEAMEKLETLTGISGFPARSFVAAAESTGHGGEWHLSSDGKWKWKGDTSSDEIVGHMFAYPLFYDMVAEGDIKERVKNLVQRIMNHIVDNNYLLIDLDGKPTRWGVWTPDSLNGATNWWYERGINSLQILSFLKAAYHITRDIKFETAYQDLIQKHHYAENTVQQKMYGPFDINHSDDELAFLPYYILFRYADDSEVLPIYTKSIRRSWTVEQPDRIPIWNIIASAALEMDCDLHIALEELQLIPMDLITWTMENSHRWDLPQDQLTDRFGYAQSVRPVPTPERGISKWNSNTYRYDSGSNGSGEDDGAYFLLPYWMGRYHGFFVE
ncbi:MAG: transcriptional regulator [Bacteroidia bacterium]|nr:transcriptional regulator [Bacteroidia bacterium]